MITSAPYLKSFAGIKPKSKGRQFWVVLLLVWGGFGVVNFLFRWHNGLDTFEVGLISGVLFVGINVFFCTILGAVTRRAMAKQMTGWLLTVVIMLLALFISLISTTVLLFTLSIYLYLRGVIPEVTMEVGSVSANGMIVFLLMLFWTVTDKLFTYIKKNTALKKAQQQTLLELKDAQINLLNGQLNPHFLFNGLNNIRSLILEDRHMAREMVTALSEILRYGLNSHKSPWVSLNSEMAVVYNYIALAKIQYEDRLIYKEFMAPGLAGVQIPPMMIQLLVENAIRHGIDHSVSGGELCVSISKDLSTEEHMLRVEVSNPGTLKSPASDHHKSTGLGLLNIEKRLQLLFGSAAAITLNEGCGRITALLIMPVKRSGE